MRRRRGWCLLGLAALLGMGLVSCSETDTLLNWEQADRGGLGVPAETFESSDMVVANAEYREPLSTGSSAYLLIGHLEREGLVEGAIGVGSDAYIKWDVSELPEGTIRGAYLNVILHDLDEAGATIPEIFSLELRRVDGAWEEDSLGLYRSPPVLGDTTLAVSSDIASASVNDTTDVPYNQLFLSQPGEGGLTDLVADWVSGAKSNHGVAVRLHAHSTQQGFLRFISRETAPVGDVFIDTTGTWPQLLVEVEVGEGDIETRVLEASADGYMIYGTTDEGLPVDGPRIEEGLILGSGYVQPLIFKLDLADVLAANPDAFPPGLAVHQATLTLTPVTGNEWSLPADDKLTVDVFQTDYEWSEESPPPPGELTGPQVSSTTISGEDTEVVLDIRDLVQLVTEGTDLSVVVFPRTGSDLFRTILFEDRESSGAPRFKMIYSLPSDGRVNLEAN